MKKIMKQLGVLMILLNVSFGFHNKVEAATTGTEQGYTYTVEDDKATITDYNGGEPKITIPEKLGGYPVTIVGADAFNKNPTIISVTIPGTVKTIKEFAFYSARNLEEVVIEDGCTEIQINAFGVCPNLEKIVIPLSVTNMEFTNSGNKIFDGDSKLIAYIEPESAAQAYFDTNEKNITYYYIEKYKPGSIEFKYPTITLNVGETYTLTNDDFNVSPSTAYIITPTEYKSSDGNIARVSDGIIEARTEGTVTINATISNKHLEKSVTTEDTTPLTVHVVEKRKKVESVSLNMPDIVQMYVGDTLQLEPTITPSDATYTGEWKNIGEQYENEETGIVSLSDKGLITALKKGYADVGYETRSIFGNVYDNKGGYIRIQVKERPLQKVENITVNVPDNIEMYIGDTIQVTPTVSPQNAVYTATWSTTLTYTASVSNTGLITALHEGLTQVIYFTETKDANTNESNQKVISIRVKKREASTPTNPSTPVIPDNPQTPDSPTTPVTPSNPATPVIPGTPVIPVTPTTPPQTPEVKQEGNISLNASKIELQKGKTIKTLDLKVNQLESDQIASVTSSNKKVLKATLNGQTIVLKGAKAYKKYVTVTVTMQSGATATCKVKVVNSVVNTKRLTVSDKKITLKKGEKQKIEVIKNPISATDKITYKSSNTKVATVDKNGKIKAKKKGKATITIISSNSKKTTCKVVVR